MSDVCRRGHELTPENVRIRPGTGWRVCRMCAKAYEQERKSRRIIVRTPESRAKEAAAARRRRSDPAYRLRLNRQRRAMRRMKSLVDPEFRAAYQLNALMRRTLGGSP